ncbi:hypothetical protein AMATHDRAFT_133377, partial [Amanita thiersii Skay4041]
LKTWTGPWVLRRIWNEPTEEGIRTLIQYAHNRRKSEIDVPYIHKLNALSEKDALQAIYQLKEKPTVIQTTGTNQIDIPCVISTTNTLETFTVKALLDSGCTGSCVNAEFITRHRINTQPLPRPIPVYNADGTQNIGGSLTHTVKLRMKIGAHEEVMDFGVSNL